MAFSILAWVFGVGLLLIGVASWRARTPYGVQLTEIADVIIGAVLVIPRLPELRSPSRTAGSSAP